MLSVWQPAKKQLPNTHRKWSRKGIVLIEHQRPAIAIAMIEISLEIAGMKHSVAMRLMQTIKQSFFFRLYKYLEGFKWCLGRTVLYPSEYLKQQKTDTNNSSLCLVGEQTRHSSKVPLFSGADKGGSKKCRAACWDSNTSSRIPAIILKGVIHLYQKTTCAGKGHLYIKTNLAALTKSEHYPCYRCRTFMYLLKPAEKLPEIA